LVWTIFDDDDEGNSFGNGDGRIQPGELIEAVTTINNTGHGIARNVQVTFDCSESIRWGSKDRFNLGDMPPGDSREIAYIFSVRKPYSGPDELPITLNAHESKGRYGFSTSPGFMLNQKASGRVSAKDTVGSETFNLLRKMKVTDVPEGRKGGYIVRNPEEAVLVVHSEIPEMQFESNNTILRVKQPDPGEYQLHLQPGTHRIKFKADGFMVEDKRYYIPKKQCKEVQVEVLE
ncbi:MAG: hypothetical protein U9R56_03780, partial [candidate division Zixibacteria bacterium]|nr:hypothetical protein [candidate division Zixibacteria bacterium]